MATIAQRQADAFARLVSKFPKRYRAKASVYLKAILLALASGDGFIDYEVEAVRDNLILVTATGTNLDARAGLYGVTRGEGTGVLDPDFQKLAPLMGMSPKQITSIINKIIDVVYGPYATHANMTCSLPGPYALVAGWGLDMIVDGGPVNIQFQTVDFADISNATAQEVADAITFRSGGKAIGTVVTNVQTGAQFVNAQTATVGTQGFIQMLGGAAQAVMKFATVRPTGQNLATFNITRVGGTDQMLYTLVSGTGPTPQAAGVLVGDYVTIRSDSVFAPANAGSFPVSGVFGASFSVINPIGVPQGPAANTNIDDFTFFQANTANILLNARPATVIQTTPLVLTVILPVTSPLVKRTLRGGAHLHGALTPALSYDGLGNLTLGSSKGFPPVGSVQPSISRHTSSGVVSSVASGVINLINAQNWPTSGAVWSQVTGAFYFYSGRTGNALTGVQPQPTGNIAGGNCAYSPKYSYTGITGNTLNGVYPDPTALVNQEVTNGSAYLVPDYAGSFLYDLGATFIAAADKITLTQPIPQGSSQTVVNVSTLPADWPQNGFVVFNFGQGSQEGPVRFNAIIGSNTIALDPSHVFKNTYLTGSSMRLVRQTGPYIPRVDGTDLAVYLTSTTPARDLISSYIQTIVAAGITVKFVITVPPEKWAVLPPLYTTNPLSTSQTD